MIREVREQCEFLNPGMSALSQATQRNHRAELAGVEPVAGSTVTANANCRPLVDDHDRPVSGNPFAVVKPRDVLTTADSFCGGSLRSEDRPQRSSATYRS